MNRWWSAVPNAAPPPKYKYFLFPFPMSRHSSPPRRQASLPPRTGSLFPRFLLPPITAVVVSIFLVLILSNLPSPSVQPAAPVSDSSSSTQSKSSVLAPLFTDEIDYWEDKILSWSEQWDLDPNLVATVMQIESCGNPRALSSAGAIGLFQVMPYHFQDGENPYQPGVNAHRGLAYLKQSLTKGKTSKLALAGYNGGIYGASRPETSWAAETKRYIYWGERIYQDALAGKKNSPRLDEWLAAGGSTLCSQAAQQQSR